MNPTAPDAPTAPSRDAGPDRLSVDRLQKLDRAAVAGTVLTAVAAVFAGVAILDWYRELYLMETAQHGLRWLVLGVAHLWLLAMIVLGTWDRAHGWTRLSSGHPGPIPVTPTRPGWHAALLSMPLWPAVAAAWRTNDASALLTVETGQQALLLALPLLVHVVSAAAIAATEWWHDRLWHRHHTAPTDLLTVQENS